jgi:hypothetical protein
MPQSVAVNDLMQQACNSHALMQNCSPLQPTASIVVPARAPQHAAMVHHSSTVRPLCCSQIQTLLILELSATLLPLALQEPNTAAAAAAGDIRHSFAHCPRANQHN